MRLRIRVRNDAWARRAIGVHAPACAQRNVGETLALLPVLTALALLASFLWGVSDFVAGHTSKALRPAAVVGWSQAIGVVILTVLVAGRPSSVVVGPWIGWSLLSGVAGSIALLSFYSALSTGTMGVVAPIAGSGAIVPVVLGVLGGEALSGRAWLGIVLAILGGALAGGPEALAGLPVRPIALAMVAAVGFGVVLFGLDRGAREALLPTLWLERLVIVAILAVLALARRDGGGVRPPDAKVLAVIGLTDLVANGLYALASSRGMVSVASVLGSLYPVWTTILAAVVLHERLRPVQVGGVVLSVAGICAIGLR